MTAQLALPLALADHAVFAGFWAGGNEATVAFLKQLAETGEGVGAWIWGRSASGKSHLLQAVCERLGAEAFYLPLEALAGEAPSVLEDLASRRCLCLDDIDAVAGDLPWEHALFDLANQLTDASGLLIASAAAPPRDAGFVMPDLLSRMSKLPIFRLAPLAEDERIHALRLRASLRGLDLPIETARFLLRRARRDMRSLYALLDRLDSEALRAQRRLTIPFVRDVLLE
ncbi:MAG TPA: DnaA regulatory inactivator Hda [Woeseiaceae bacterium]|jgi:DnaA family protein|nr:DnaA regulatory inactivator Hda [Woeseiaceae bacterium]